MSKKILKRAAALLNASPAETTLTPYVRGVFLELHAYADQLHTLLIKEYHYTREELADAWEEGHAAGVKEAVSDRDTKNPYEEA